MARKTTKWIEPIPDTLDNVVKCLVGNTKLSNEDEYRMSEKHDVERKTDEGLTFG